MIGNVVVPAINIPRERIDLWYQYNINLLNKYQFNPIIVTDFDDSSINAIKYPVSMPIFNTSKAKNYGIRKSIFNIIITTDIDVLLGEEFLEAASQIKSNEIIVPLYCSILDWCDINCRQPWAAPCGTVCACKSAWETIHGYDERLEGYGSDDACPINNFVHYNYRLIKNQHNVYHVSHSGRMEDVYWESRQDQWNKNGINPLNKEHNRPKVFDSINEWVVHPRSQKWGCP